MTKFYVYGLIDSSTDTCFYVGKGSGNRMYAHEKRARNNRSPFNPHLDRKIRKLLEQGTEIACVKFYETDDEEEAFDLEERKIREIGIDTLCNLWHGGKGGRMPSAEVRLKISIGRRGIVPSDDTRRKLSLAHAGKKQSAETTAKRSKALKNKPQTEKQKAANATRGNKGRKLSAEHRQKLREAKLANPVRYWSGKTHTEDTKNKIRDSLQQTRENKHNGDE